MQGAGRYADNPRRHKNFVRIGIGWKHGAPTPIVSGSHVGIPSGHQDGEDVERNETTIRDEGKKVVAGRAACWPVLGVANQVVHGVQTDDEVHTRLIG